MAQPLTTQDRTSGMIALAGGTFTMGSERFYPEEAPLRRVTVDGFLIDETPVTNRQFARFVEATGHVTVAERAPDPKDYPGMSPDMAQAGSLVFRKPAGPVPLHDIRHWWHYVPGADWRRPGGPEADIEALGLWDHPVVQVAHADAVAYAAWAGKSLPTEAEFEYAARGGTQDQDYAWGDTLAPGGQMMANYWQGQFPYANTRLDGWEGTSPVRSFPVNGYGLYDMIGNVWEWTSDWWSDRPIDRRMKKGSCCTVRNPRGGDLKKSFDVTQPHVRIGRKVLGSGLVDHSQKMTVAARAMAEKKTVGHRS